MRFYCMWHPNGINVPFVFSFNLLSFFTVIVKFMCEVLFIALFIRCLSFVFVFRDEIFIYLFHWHIIILKLKLKCENMFNINITDCEQHLLHDILISLHLVWHFLSVEKCVMKLYAIVILQNASSIKKKSCSFIFNFWLWPKQHMN